MDYKSDFEEGMCHVSMGGMRYMHHAGTGAPITFLHGLGSSAEEWSKTVEYLPDTADVYLIDMLGFGRSEKPELGYGATLHAQMFREFIALQEGSAPGYVVGHSYGGWVAAHYASMPFPLKGLILISPAGLHEYIAELSRSPNRANIRQRMIDEAMAYGNNERHVIESILDSNPLIEELNSDILSSISRPTLILWGSEDKVVDSKYANIFSKNIKGSALEMIKGAGHSPNIDKPAEVAADITAFILKCQALG